MDCFAPLAKTVEAAQSRFETLEPNLFIMKHMLQRSSE
jgi:hypothetical protein